MELRWREPEAIRYIKLGKGGSWASEAISGSVILAGYQEGSHPLCADGNWKAVHAGLVESGKSPGTASQQVTEMRAFYELPDDTLWITFAAGHLFWAFAEGPVEALEEQGPDRPRRLRRTRDGWHRYSLTGEPLSMHSLSSALTKVANYQMTICKVPERDYLLRRIRGDSDPLHEEALAIRANMLDVCLRLIRRLHWREFETLIDLIFTRAGWRRISMLGENQADIDLLLERPITGDRAWVQVKSAAGQNEVDEYLRRFMLDGSCQLFVFACHSPKGELTLSAEPNHLLWTSAALADAALGAGLLEWLLEKTR